MERLFGFFSDPFILGVSGILVGFLLAIRMFPIIINLLRALNIMEQPVARSSHSQTVPSLGGVGIFFAFSLTMMIVGRLSNLLEFRFEEMLILLAAITILFFVGVKDDLIGVSPLKKIIGQALAVLLVVIISDVRIHSFYGLFGIGELTYSFSVAFTVMAFIFFINAFNFVDGIDGLAGTVAIMSSLFMGGFFLWQQDYFMLLISLTLIGANLGFLRFNLSKKNRLFMGDSGSLFIGFLLAYQAITFLTSQNTIVDPLEVSNAPILVIAILAYPIIDTLRVFIIRILNNRNPFLADTNHIHHRLLGLGFSHRSATIMIATFNLIIVGVAFLISNFGINTQLAILAGSAQLIGFFPFFIIKEQGQIKLKLPFWRIVH